MTVDQGITDIADKLERALWDVWDNETSYAWKVGRLEAAIVYALKDLGGPDLWETMLKKSLWVAWRGGSVDYEG